MCGEGNFCLSAPTPFIVLVIVVVAVEVDMMSAVELEVGRYGTGAEVDLLRPGAGTAGSSGPSSSELDAVFVSSDLKCV